MKSRKALESITTNKASGGDGIPVELFQILKDDALKVLHSICQQIWKTQQWQQDWKRSVFIPIPKKDNAKECSNYRTIVLISHASKVTLKILQARLQQYMKRDLPNVPAGFRKVRRTRDQITNIRWIMEKQESSRKTSISVLFSWQNSISLCPASFCISRPKFACYSRCCLTSYFCIPIPYDEKDIIFLVLVPDNVVGLHRTISIQLLQHQWMQCRLGLLIS